MKKITIITILLLVGAGISGCTQNQNLEGEESIGEIKNPVLPGDRPDPTFIKIGETYWASATSNEWSPLFPIFKSDDLQHWELVTYVFPDGAPGWAVNNFWAPELAYDEDQDRVYVYYTARDKESGRLSTAAASADRPEGPYTDHGPLVAQELGSIDGYEARDRDGTLYLLWKEDGNSRGEPTPMWAQEMNEDRTELLGEKHELFRNDEEWEMHLVEGISVFREGDYFYALYSAGSCCDIACDYRTGVARSETLLGEWEKYDDNPTLTNNEDWKCTGHGSAVKYGDDYFYLYHAYSRDGSVYVGREAVLEKLIWTDDGWPVFQNDASYNRERAEWDFSDDFTEGLNPLWQWRVTQDIDYTTGENGLMVRASRENENLGTLLVQQTTSPDYEISTIIDLASTGNTTQGGIAIVGARDNSFAAPVAAMGISAGNESLMVWETRDRQTDIIEEVSIDSADQFQLKIAVSDGHILTFSAQTGDGWQTVAEHVDVSHLVPWGMGFRFGMVAKGDSSEFVNFREFRSVNF